MTEQLNTNPLGTEQIEALERIADSILAHSAKDHTGYTIAQATKRLIADFRAERAAHQATQAELERYKAALYEIQELPGYKLPDDAQAIAQRTLQEASE